MMPERTYAGYTLGELEKIAMAKATRPTGTVECDAYMRASMAALPFLIARIRQIDRRLRRAGEGHQGRRQGAAR